MQDGVSTGQLRRAKLRLLPSPFLLHSPALQNKDGALKPATLKLCKDLMPLGVKQSGSPACYKTVTGYLAQADGTAATKPTIFELASGPLSSLPPDTTETCSQKKIDGAHWSVGATGWY